MNLETKLINIINNISKILESLIIFNNIAKYYEEKLNEETKFNKGIQIITIKILIGFIFIILYCFGTLLYKASFGLLVYP